jgi:hypothetical protein
VQGLAAAQGRAFEGGKSRAQAFAQAQAAQRVEEFVGDNIFDHEDSVLAFETLKDPYRTSIKTSLSRECG